MERSNLIFYCSIVTRRVLRAVADDIKGLKDYLDENGGIRFTGTASASTISASLETTG